MEVGDSQLPAPKPGYGTQEHQPSSFQRLPTGLSPSMAGRSRPLRLSQRGGGRVHHSTSPMSFLTGFGLDSSHFARCYSGNLNWFLFLPLLRCFSSGGSRSSRSATDPRRSPRREVSLRHPRIYGCMRLPGAYRGLPRPSSALKPSHPPDGVACRALIRLVSFGCRG